MTDASTTEGEDHVVTLALPDEAATRALGARLAPVLRPGDSILFDGEMQHAYVALGDEPVIMLMSNTVPRDGLPPGNNL